MLPPSNWQLPLMVPMRDALYILAIVTGALLYLAPCIIAHFRRHHYRWPITAINFFLGITGVAWLLCLVWAVWPENPSQPPGDVPVKLTKIN